MHEKFPRQPHALPGCARDERTPIASRPTLVRFLLRRSGSTQLTRPAAPLPFLPLDGVFVYRLGHGPLKAERRVRFPYALPSFVMYSPEFAGPSWAIDPLSLSANRPPERGPETGNARTQRSTLLPLAGSWSHCAALKSWRLRMNQSADLLIGSNPISAATSESGDRRSGVHVPNARCANRGDCP